jgi:5-dehydro-2-deoxygluconokinase
MILVENHTMAASPAGDGVPQAGAAAGRKRYSIPFDPARPVDLVCLGRVAVDFYAEQIGSPLREAQSFRMYFGGSPGNVAIGAARLGLTVEMFSRVGADELGHFLRDTLVREGVGTRLLTDDPDHLSGLVVLGVAPPDHFPLIFYRENCADMETRPSAGDRAVMLQAKALLVTGTGLSRPSTAEATMEIVREARDAGTAVVFDVDYRPVLWGLLPKGDGETRYLDSERVTEAIGRLLPRIDLLVGTEEEIRIAGGDEDVDAAIAALRERTAATIVCKRGVQGCSVFPSGEAEQRYPARQVEVLNVLGAGDGFLAGFLRGWLRGESFSTSAAWANANGALVVSRHGCAPAMGTFEEITWFLSQPDPQQAARSPELARLHRRAGRTRESELLVLACDHRLPFEREADQAGVDRREISRLKRWLYEGFERAAERSGNSGCALLIDPVYGSEVLAEATTGQRRVGVPIEAAGSMPTSWIKEGPVYPQLLARPARWFVKALFHLHPSQPESLRVVQLERLTELQAACVALDRDLMIEIIEPPGSSFSEGDLPRLVGESAGAGIEPRWWKLPSLSSSDWRELEHSLDTAGSDARIVILGGGQSLDRFDDAFRLAATSPRSAGFAVGRSVFGDAMKAFFAGTAEHEAIVSQVAERYERLISSWRTATSSARAAR